MDERRARRVSFVLLLLVVAFFVGVIYVGDKSQVAQKLTSAVKSATTQASDTAGNAADNVKDTVQANAPGMYTVTKFVDGDTIEVNMDGHTETIRLIGVDTPETHDPRVTVQCFGIQAAAFTKNFIGNNSVRLEADPTNSNRDRYNRLLRYVYLPDGQLLNSEIIRQGYGFAYVLFPFEKMDEFKQIETEARTANRGLWAGCQVHKDGQKEQTNPAQ
jgi:micrococcal nuclease